MISKNHFCLKLLILYASVTMLMSLFFLFLIVTLCIIQNEALRSNYKLYKHVSQLHRCLLIRCFTYVFKYETMMMMVMLNKNSDLFHIYLILCIHYSYKCKVSRKFHLAFFFISITLFHHFHSSDARCVNDFSSLFIFFSFFLVKLITLFYFYFIILFLSLLFAFALFIILSCDHPL